MINSPLNLAHLTPYKPYNKVFLRTTSGYWCSGRSCTGHHLQLNIKIQRLPSGLVAGTRPATALKPLSLQFLLQILPHSIPRRDALERVADRLDVVEHEQKEEGDTEDTGDAIELLDTDHDDLLHVPLYAGGYGISDLMPDAERIEASHDRFHG